MRRSMALALLVVLAAAGCAGRDNDDGGIATANGGATPATSATPSADSNKTGDKDTPIKFSQCMREHGMPWFPDPQVDEGGGSGLKINIPRGQDKAKVDAAMEACKKLMPNGGEPMKLDPATIEQMRQMAKCMRANGVPNFPDPDANGMIRIDGDKLGIGPDDPAFKAADKACARFRPTPPPGAGSGLNTSKG
jgi:hypothetical protein